jgi:ABC-2 type transport system permease protein
VSSVRVAMLIAVRILRQRVRDRSAVVFSVLTPLGLALAFSVLIPNEFSSFHTRFVVVDGDGGPMASALVNQVLGAVRDAGVADIDPLADEAAARSEVEAGTAGAAIVIPAGFSAAVQAGAPAELRIIGGEYAISVEVARSIVARFAENVGATQLIVATVASTGGAVNQAVIAGAQAVAGGAGPIAVATPVTEQLQAGLATFYSAAMAVMFVFFATQYGALAMLADRQGGTMARLLAAPIAPGSIVLGASLAGFALGLISMTVLAIATTLLRGANWGPLPLVALLVLAAVFAAMGISMVVSSLAKTPQQAGSLNSIVALSLAAIGGVFVPLSQAPEAMVSLSQITPHAWFLRAIDTLSGPSPTIGDIMPSLAVLVAIGALTGAVGLARARRSLVPR